MDLITQTDKLPVMGETLSGLAFRTVCGGKGGNQAFAAAKLGGNVTMLGCVGQDGFGSELCGNLEKAGVDCSHIEVCEGVSSGIATITVYQGDNSIIIIAGANGKVSTEYITINLTPDHPAYSADMAHAMINANRQVELDEADCLLKIAPDLISLEEVCKLKQIKNTKYDKRIALYDAGIKQWDTNMSVTMIIRGIKQNIR